MERGGAAMESDSCVAQVCSLPPKQDRAAQEDEPGRMGFRYHGTSEDFLQSIDRSKATIRRAPIEKARH